MSGRLAVTAAVLVAGLLAFPGVASAWFVDGVESVRSTSAATSAAKTATVACPPGKRVMSGGVEVTPPDGRVLINYIRPSASLSSVLVSASEDEAGVAENWTVTAYAMCAPAPPGLQLVKATSAASSASKGANAVCPSGKRVLGTGGEVSGAQGQLLIHGLTPDPTLSKVTAGAYEDETGTTASWTVTAYAICGSPGQGVVRRNRVSAYVSASPRYISQPCEAHEVAVGMGGAINGTGNQLVLQGIHPAVDEGGPGVIAAEDRTGTSGTWSPEVFTICGVPIYRSSEPTSTHGENTAASDAPCEEGQYPVGTGAETQGGRGEVWFDRFGPLEDPPESSGARWHTASARVAQITAHAICAPTPAGVETVTGFPAAAPDALSKTVSVRCPAGKRVLSGASRVEEDGNLWMLQSMIPSTDLTSLRVDLRTVALVSSTAPWTASATAHCAPPPPGLARVSRATPADSSEYRVATATCPADKHVVGTGALISPRTGRVVIDDIRPDDQLRSVTVEAVESYQGESGDWNLTAYAVCANR